MIGLAILVALMMGLTFAAKRWACRVPQRVVVRHVAVVPLIVLVLALLWLAPPRTASADPGTYYVSTNGSDSNLGTEAQPFRTINKGVSLLDPGDTLYIREGIYHENVTISAHGTADQPITISAYSNENPIIDGQYTLPPGSGQHWTPLVSVSGDHVVFRGFEIRNSTGINLMVSGSNNQIQYLNVHHALEHGVFVTGDDNLVEHSKIWWNAANNEYGQSPYPWWGTGLSAARRPSRTTLRENEVYNNWGEGLSTFEAYDTTIEDNVVYDNWAVNVYISDIDTALVQRNLVYCTGDAHFTNAPGIALCDEVADPVSRDVTIINNLVLGCNRCFYFWLQGGDTGLKNSLIAHNTFVNSHNAANFQIESGGHENSRIENNIFVQEDDLPIAVVTNNPELHFSHNLWSKNPSTTVAGQGDVIADPRLAQSGSTDPGLLDPDWFRLLSDSPAVDVGLTFSEVPDDFDGVPRPLGAGYDIGAYEYGERMPPEYLSYVYLPVTRK